MFVIPVEKSNPVFKQPYAVYGIITLNVFFFIITAFDIHFDKIVIEYGFIPSNHYIFTLFSSMFLHGGLWHILGNMYFLWVLGDNVEDVLGPLKFSLVYIICGLGASLFHYISNTKSIIPAIGASGAISGIMGVYIMFFPKAKFNLAIILIRFYVGRIPTTAFAALLVWFIEQFLLGVFVLASKADYIGVAFWAHIGGFVFGLACGKILMMMGYLKKYLNQYAEMREKKLKEEEELEIKKAKEKEERGSFWGSAYSNTADNEEEEKKEFSFFKKYCYNCKYFDEEPGVCLKLHEQIIEYPKKTKKCNGKLFVLCD